MEHRDGELAALELWSQFPATATPRPLVLVGPPVMVQGGFDSGEAKIAYMEGAVDASVPLAPGVLDALCPQRSRAYHGPRLQVTAARRVTAPFLTDRGPRELPAWQVTLGHFDGFVEVLEPATAAQAWRPHGRDYPRAAGRSLRAVLDEDGLALTLSFVGSPRAYTDYSHAAVRESDTAVLVRPVAVDHDAGGIRLLYAERREVRATLARPLGDRVVISDAGDPVPVTGN